ncbi:MAG: response regulator [Candidatus Aminicenantes bacterium]|nr:response regulator [Candidatus Aminicenantes bacterium]
MSLFKHRVFIGFILFFLLSHIQFGASTQSSQFLIKLWGEYSGLPQNTVNSMVQTKDGYIWLATFGGLARFDGLTFSIYDEGNTPQLKTNRFVKLQEDRKGNLWVFPENELGVICFSGNEATYFDTSLGIPSNTVRTVLLDRNGGLWLGTDQGLCRMEAQQVTVYTTSHGLDHNNIYTLFEDSSGRIWIGTETGLNYWEKGVIKCLSRRMPIPQKRIWYIDENNESKICFTTSDQMFTVDEDKLIEVFSLELTGYTNHVLRDKHGGFWFSTMNGVQYWDSGQVQIFSQETGLSGDSIKCVLIDHEENIWIGTDGAGLNRMTKSNIDTFQSVDNMPRASIVPICSDGEEGIWIGGNGEGLFHLNNNTVRCWTRDEGLSNFIWSLLLDHDRNLWVGTYGDGVFCLNQDRRIIFHLNDELISNVVFALYEDRSGNIWIGTDKGLNLYQKGRLSSYTEREGLVNNNIKFITQDRQGMIWIGTTGGMSAYKDGRFINFTTADGLSNNYVRDIYEDEEGTLWIGTYGGGLSRFKNGSFFNFNRENGLYDNIVSRILEDDENNLWMSCNHGIYRVKREDLNDFAEGIISSYSCHNYGIEEGMLSSECNGGGQPAGWKTKDGKLWFPTIRGVIRIDPSKRNTIPPLVNIEKVILDGQSLESDDKIILPPGKKRLEFRFTGLSFRAPQKNRFRFKLDGFDSGWNDAGTLRVASYTNLPYGRYIFYVKASNNEGIWNEQDAVIPLEVKPFFYQTIWFLSLCILLAGVLVFSGYEWRLSRIKAREKRLKFLVEERTEELAQANQQLSDANIELEKLSIVASETVNAVTIMDATGNIEWINAGFERMFGYTQNELIAKKGKNLVAISANPDIQQIVDKSIRDQKAETYETFIETKKGSKIWTQTTLTPIINSDGQVDKLVAIETDISKIKAAEEAAERANQSKSEFLARMSHEIRTPMNGVVGFTDMLLDTELTEEQMEFARTINRSAEALITLLNDILDFSKIEAGELSFDPIDFDPEVTVFDICELISPRIQAKPVEILCRIGDSVPPYVKADPGRFRQVIVNLMGNATKFTERGEIELILDVAEETKTGIKFHVQILDTGIGIPEKKLDQVFDVFQQADGSTTRKYGGTGLGLAICRQISRLMKGDVWVESQEGKGSTFHFTCWVQKSNKQPPRELKSEYLSGKRALIVDDHPANLEILTYSLKKAGMSVFSLTEPREVLPFLKHQLAQSQPIDIGIFDIQMPGLSGFDLAAKIRRQDKPLSQLPLLAFSSSTLSRSKKFKEAGFNGFLPKPIHRRKLLQMVGRLLGRAEEEMVTQHIISEESKQSVHILLAEDNLINQKLACFMLQKAGYTVTVVNDGQEAVDTFTASPQTYDLIMMDIQMPGLDGRQATQKIRQLGFPDIPIIAMTAEAMKGDEEKCLAAGMNDYIPKPIKREKVYTIVKKWHIDR